MSIYIRKGTEEGAKWGLHDVEIDNRDSSETWVHLYNEDRSDYRTVEIGFEDILDLIENMFENATDTPEILGKMDACIDILKELQIEVGKEKKK